MKAKNLRIGNLVDLYGSTATVQRFDLNDRPPRGLAVDKGEPIPLTEKWLRNLSKGCTFKKQSEGTLTIDRFRLIWKPAYKYWYIVDDHELTYITKVSYVHEWQNVFFALNGTELELE